MSIKEIVQRCDELILLIASKLNEDSSLTNAIATLSELKKTLKDSDEDALQQALRDREKVRKAQEIVDLVEKRRANRTLAYIDDIIAVHPELKYPMKIPTKLFESERVKKTLVICPAATHGKERVDEISIDEMMSQLFPGLLTHRYGRLMKVPVGGWSPRYRVSPAGVSVITDENDAFDIDRDELPPDYPAGSQREKVYVPQEMKLKGVEDYARPKYQLEETEPIEPEEAESETYLRFCTRCGAIHDGDESCSCGSAYLTYATPPKTYPLIWNVVRMKDEQPMVSDPLFLRMFEKVAFGHKVEVMKVLHGFERSYMGQLWRVRYDKLFGESFQTDGILFRVSTSLISQSYQKIKVEDPILLRDLKLLCYISTLDEVAGPSFGLTFNQSLAVVKSILLRAITSTGRVPITAEELDRVLEQFVDRPDELRHALGDLSSTNQLNLGLRDQDVDRLSSGPLKEAVRRVRDEACFEAFVSDIFVHSLKHYIQTSAMVLLGVDEKDIRCHFRRGTREILVYDNLPEGNGCAETLRKLARIPLSERIQTLRKSVEKDIPVALPARDFYSILEEFLTGCRANQVDSVYWGLIRDPKTAELVERSSADDETRQEVLQELRSRNLDEFSISYLDALLRYGSHYTILKSVRDEELFLFRLAPEALLSRLTLDEKKKISPGMDPKDLDKSVLGKIQDSLEMCIDGCPVCLLASFCDMGVLSVRYLVSRRVLETAYRLIRDNVLITVGSEPREALLQKATELLETQGTLYVRGSYGDAKDVLELGFRLLGQPIRDGRAYLNNFSCDPDNRFILKMEVS